MRPTALRGSIIICALVATLVAAVPASAAEVTRERWAGSDRYLTAASIARNAFDAPVPVAYVATGQGFADALAAVPAAAGRGAPILLVSRDAVPDATKQAIAALRPGSLVVLGGTGAISDATVAQLQSTSGVAVRRIAGLDRFETAAAVVRDSFTGAESTVFLTPGRTFTEALAAGPAAASMGAPLLLLEDSGIPAATQTELDRLDPSLAYVVGSSAGATAAANALSAAGTTVTRLQGSSWVTMSVAISAEVFSDGADAVFVAQGDDYADALAGGAAAAALGAPLLLTNGVRSHGACATSSFAAEESRLGATRSIVLGGEGAVTDGAAGAAVCTEAAPVDVETDLAADHEDLVAALGGIRSASTRGLVGPARVQLIMYDDREQLAQAYSRETGASIETSRQIWTSSEAVGGVNGDTIFFNPSLARERRGSFPTFLFKVGAHEWFHLHQATVAGTDALQRTPAWLLEATAEWFAWRVATANGYSSLSQSLRSTGTTCCSTRFNSVRDWETNEGFQAFDGVYEVSPLAAEHLAALDGSDSVDRVVWELIGEGMTGSAALESTSGMGMDALYSSIDAYLRSQFTS